MGTLSVQHSARARIRGCSVTIFGNVDISIKFNRSSKVADSTKIACKPANACACVLHQVQYLLHPCVPTVSACQDSCVLRSFPFSLCDKHRQSWPMLRRISRWCVSWGGMRDTTWRIHPSHAALSCSTLLCAFFGLNACVGVIRWCLGSGGLRVGGGRGGEGRCGGGRVVRRQRV